MAKKFPPIALTGTTGFLGSTLLKTLESDPHTTKILAIDKRTLKGHAKKTKFLQINLLEPESYKQIAHEMKKLGCKTLIHLALPTRPKRDPELTHELLTIGTTHILYAAEEAGIKKLILGSTTEVYGANAKNPSFLTEDYPAHGHLQSEFLRDRIDAERQFERFEEEHKNSVVTILRPCTILGPTVKNFKVSFLQQDVIPTVMGYDPIVQSVHEKDVMRAFMLAIEKDFRGTFNIVGDGVIPLSRVLKMIKKTALPIPSIIIYPLAQFFWYSDVWSAPASHLDFLRYSCIADGEKAKRVMKFNPIYSTQETIWSFVGRKGREKGSL